MCSCYVANVQIIPTNSVNAEYAICGGGGRLGPVPTID